VELIPLVPRKPSVEVMTKRSTNKLKKRPSALTLHSNQSQPSSSRPGTPSSQNSDTQPQRPPNKLRKRSRSFTRSSPDSIQQSLPVQAPVQTSPPPPAQVLVPTVKDRDRDKLPEVTAVFHRPIGRVKMGPPPSPSNGKRFEGVGMPRRRSPEKVAARPSQVVPLPPSPGMAKTLSWDWEVI